LLDIRGKKACGGAYLFRQDTPLPNHSLTNGGYHPIFDEDITIYEPDDSALPTCILLEFLHLSVSRKINGSLWKGNIQNHHPPSNIAKELGKGGKNQKGHKGYIHYIGWSFCLFFAFSNFLLFLYHIEEPLGRRKP
jgi:hypothetical protein